MKTVFKKHLIIICLTTLSFIGCKQDNCKNTTCLNGGVCIEGNCNCEDGWGTKDCSEQLNPDYYYFNGISFRVNDTLDNLGNVWDLGTIPNKYPDLIVYLITESNSFELLTLSGDLFKENAQPFIYHEFKFEDDNVLFSSGEFITIRVMDRYLDGDPYEATIMQEIGFYPFDNENKSTTRTIEKPHITLKIELDPVW